MVVNNITTLSANRYVSYTSGRKRNKMLGNWNQIHDRVPKIVIQSSVNFVFKPPLQNGELVFTGVLEYRVLGT